MLTKYLYLNSVPVKKKELCSFINVSMPTLSKLVKEIQLTFQKKYPTNDFFLKIEKDTIKLISKPKANFSKILNTFVEMSLPYQLFIYLFKQKKINSVYLELEWNISQSNLQNVIKQCNKILKSYNLKIQRGQIYGSLKQKTFFYYAFYWICEDKKVFNIQLETFKFLKDAVINSLNYYGNISYIQEKKISLWISLSIFFIKSTDNEIIVDKFNFHSFDVSILFSQEVIKKLTHLLTNEQKDNLINLIFLGLFSIDILSYDLAYLLTQYKETICFEITNQLLSLLGLFYDFSVSFEKVLKLRKDLFSFVARTYYFEGTDSLSMDGATIQYLYQKNITIYRKKICDLLLKRTKRLLSKQYTTHELNYLFFNFLCLISNLKLKNEFSVKIALLIKTPNLMLDAIIPSFERHVSSQYSITLSEYTATQYYDLVISNSHMSKNTSNNYNELFYVTSLDIAGDLEKIYLLLEKLIEKKINKLINNL